MWEQYSLLTVMCCKSAVEPTLIQRQMQKFENMYNEETH